MNACERTNYKRALREMRAWTLEELREHGIRKIPDWVQSAMRQHAEYFAKEKCAKGRK